MQRKLSLLDWAILLLCSLSFVYLARYAIREKSPTFDENVYPVAGHYYLQGRGYDFNQETPSLGKILLALPSWVRVRIELPVYNPPEDGKFGYASMKSTFDYSRETLYGRNPHVALTLVNSARVVSIVAGLVSAWLLWVWSLQLWGTWGARLSLCLWCFDPNAIAHSGLGTLDMLLTLAVLLASYSLWRLTVTSHWKWILLSGFFMACAVCIKQTGLILYLAVLIIAVIERRKQAWFHLAIAVLVSVVAINGIYLFQETTAFLLPSPYIQSLILSMQRAQFGHWTYFFGSASQESSLLYLPVTFALKSPPGLLLLLPIVAGTLWLAKSEFRKFAVLLLVPLCFGTFVILVNRADIGLRYILPCYPFIFVLCGIASTLPQLLKQELSNVTHARAYFLFLAIIAASTVWSGTSIHPEYISYFNFLAGGPEKGHLYVVDSNLDWGQDLNSLGRFVSENKITEITLKYFGSTPPEFYGIRHRPYACNTFPDGYTAVSVTYLQGGYGNEECFRLLRQTQPYGRIGYSLFIFHR